MYPQQQSFYPQYGPRRPQINNLHNYPQPQFHAHPPPNHFDYTQNNPQHFNHPYHPQFNPNQAFSQQSNYTPFRPFRPNSSPSSSSSSPSSSSSSLSFKTYINNNSSFLPAELPSSSRQVIVDKKEIPRNTSPVTIEVTDISSLTSINNSFKDSRNINNNDVDNKDYTYFNFGNIRLMSSWVVNKKYKSQNPLDKFQQCILDNLWNMDLKAKPFVLGSLSYYFTEIENRLFCEFNYFVVYKGLKTGIYKTWEETKLSLMNYDETPGFKGFYDLKAAKQFAYSRLGSSFYFSPSVNIDEFSFDAFVIESNTKKEYITLETLRHRKMNTWKFEITVERVLEVQSFLLQRLQATDHIRGAKITSVDLYKSPKERRTCRQTQYCQNIDKQKQVDCPCQLNCRFFRLDIRADEFRTLSYTQGIKYKGFGTTDGSLQFCLETGIINSILLSSKDQAHMFADPICMSIIYIFEKANLHWLLMQTEVSLLEPDTEPPTPNHYHIYFSIPTDIFEIPKIMPEPWECPLNSYEQLRHYRGFIQFNDLMTNLKTDYHLVHQTEFIKIFLSEEFWEIIQHIPYKIPTKNTKDNKHEYEYEEATNVEE